MKSMKERLRQLRKALGLSQDEFGRKLGMSNVAISYMESGRTALSKQNVRLICLTFNVREEWFRTGAGEMLDQAASLSAGEKRLLAVFRQLSPTARRMLIEYAEKLVADEQELRESAKKAPKSPKKS